MKVPATFDKVSNYARYSQCHRGWPCSWGVITALWLGIACISAVLCLALMRLRGVLDCNIGMRCPTLVNRFFYGRALFYPTEMSIQRRHHIYDVSRPVFSFLSQCLIRRQSQKQPLQMPSTKPQQLEIRSQSASVPKCEALCNVAFSGTGCTTLTKQPYRNSLHLCSPHRSRSGAVLNH